MLYRVPPLESSAETALPVMAETPAMRAWSETPAANGSYLLTVDDLSRAGLAIACQDRTYRSPKVDANGRLHHPDTGRFISKVTAEAVRQTVHERVRECLTEAARARVTRIETNAQLKLGSGVQVSIGNALETRPHGGGVEGDLSFFSRRSTRSEAGIGGAFLTSRTLVRTAARRG